MLFYIYLRVVINRKVFKMLITSEPDVNKNIRLADKK